jgi:hypothetical protein
MTKGLRSFYGDADDLEDDPNQVEMVTPATQERPGAGPSEAAFARFCRHLEPLR